MAKKTLPLITSTFFNSDIYDIHQYGVETFGLESADFFITQIYSYLEKLSINMKCTPSAAKSQQNPKYTGILLLENT